MSFNEQIDRKGTYCTQWDYIEDRFGKNDLLPFTISDTDFKVPTGVEVALLERLQHPIFGYTRWNHSDFKAAVAHWYKEHFGHQIDEDWLVYSPSVIYSIKQLICLLSESGEGVIIQTPAYDAFYKLIAGNDRKLVMNELIYQNGTYQLDFENLSQLLERPENKILLLCSPHNPTGRVWTKKELVNIIELAKKNEVFIISDEIHMDILRKGQQHRPLTEFIQKNVAVVTSGSKTFNFPGLIFSYGLIPDPSLRQRFLHQMKEADGLSSTSIFGLVATISAYEKEGSWVTELNQYIDDNIAFVTTYLKQHHPEIIVTKSEATYLMWLDCSQVPFNMEQLQQRMIERGKVAIMSGEVYGETSRNFLRLNVGCPRKKLEEGLRRLTESLG
ncbi:MULTISPECIES: MalY/PatB family protein [unclassified Enterococcus]|uniref:MalY/PatB family protein n=1 Tax=unclassified Enterococcus TaxID=2608891 RepID=UPI001A918908|nr:MULTISPECIES: MalY/PatB family protein [unclassified Enterococcus]MBO0461099.1 pyridoxal phosphate-dependent aminotransferase [Enterococcus sp. DIV1298c]MBO1300112.1 pyridoxal phosphate-dependent aminotransferase [Enterococcus sp. DIV1271a]